MFEAGSLWKPPPLKKVRPPVEPATAESGQRRGQLTSRSGGGGGGGHHLLQAVDPATCCY